MPRPTPFDPLFKARVPGLRVERDFDLTNKTSMKMRASASVFAEVDHPEALHVLLNEAREHGWPAYLLGGGKNTLFAQSNFEGIVFSLGRFFKEIAADPDDPTIVRAGAAVTIQRLIDFAHDEAGLMGVEFLNMIPGTVGGSLAGNAGAGGKGLCDLAERICILTRDGFLTWISRGQYQFGYRHSDLRQAIVLMADLRLEPLDKNIAEARMKDFADKKKHQPYNQPSSGCIFKNPKLPDGKECSAGKLIDDSGLKGYAIRCAQVSEKHANFLVNLGGATGEDFLALISLVRDVVRSKTGVSLQTEVQIVGGPLNSVLLQ